MSDLIDLHLAALRAENRSPCTVTDRERMLRCLDRDLPAGIEQALPDELVAWLGYDGWTNKTRETYWCHLVGFYRWAVRGRVQRLSYDPSIDIPRPRVGRHLPRVATDRQLAHALAALVHPARLAVALAAGLGARSSEAAKLEREHCDERRAFIRGKGDRHRMVPMQPDVWAEIADAPPGRLITDHGQPVDGKWLTRTVAASLRRIGEPVTLHWFRGSYATRLRRAGVDTLAISRLLGHASVSTTQRYVAVDDADLSAAVAKLPPLPMEPRPALTRPGNREPRAHTGTNA